ncbi:LuxR family transcriptional regulator [Azoarcus olearius]|uniref:helix-turn-helix transcriptional regulator n=1 Tax=Azoarcus sp. (strain BH72) TaxID=418699 RepID=UPI000806139D|nr:LuxR C-terminal-related transcriptional regulator [Azoarcus olearius]ANQ85632.1 LuxR family transcriptional regulator [Azoarcus olearius]
MSLSSPGSGAGAAPATDAAPGVAAEAELVAHLELAGRRCRVLRVDGCVPGHQVSPGGKGVRLTYVKDEIAHFDFQGHRYAVVAEAPPRPRPSPGKRPPAPADIRELLTSRELQVVQFACMGYLTKQIADRLHISEFTVRSYLKSVYAKLGVRSRAAMACCYMQALKQVDAGEE